MTCRPPNYRCAATTCERCARRYASRLTRRILSIHPHRLHRVQFATTFSLSDFRHFRVRARNALDHHRRDDRWMREVSLFTWLGWEGSVRGVVALNSVSEAEFARTVEWARPTLVAISQAELLGAVLLAMRPGVIANTAEGRYQSVKFSVGPQRPNQHPYLQSPPPEPVYIEPMPTIF